MSMNNWVFLLDVIHECPFKKRFIVKCNWDLYSQPEMKFISGLN